MQKQEPISNQTQIFRHDARGCFVEAKCDRFHLDRVHLQFVAYDKNRPQGQRYTNNVNIYIPIPEFLVLYQEAASGVLHGLALCQVPCRMGPAHASEQGQRAKQPSRCGTGRYRHSTKPNIGSRRSQAAYNSAAACTATPATCWAWQYVWQYKWQEQCR